MMFEYHIDGVSFKLKEKQDLSFLSKFGKMFCAFDEQDSGNIAFGFNDGLVKRFVKVAGLRTKEYEGNPSDAVVALKKAMPLYEDLKHPNLIELIEHYQYNNLYVAVFKWVNGECLHDHWNFYQHPKYIDPQSPYFKYKQLSLKKRMKSFLTICSFFQYIAKKEYVAIDFYDGSIMYDFENDKTIICDIDLFEKSPYINTMGRMWGSSRFMSPEEYQLNATIDEITNVYTLGAIAFMMFGDDRDHSFEKWQTTKDLFNVVCKATNPNRVERYQSINEFVVDWNNEMKQ